jgi:type IV pilus assembly protein PilN
MIKVNLLPQRKVKRAADPGQTQVALGFGAILAAAAAVAFLLYLPMRSEKKAYQAKAAELAEANNRTQRELADFETLKKVVAEQEARKKSIDELAGVRAVPANVMHELGRILTLGGKLSMTREMSEKVGTGPGSDPNKAFQTDWDPKRVWINSFAEKKGEFTLEGGARSDKDVTQLAKRLQASVHFVGVTPQGGERVLDGGIEYFKFTITGKVVY